MYWRKAAMKLIRDSKVEEFVKGVTDTMFGMLELITLDPATDFVDAGNHASHLGTTTGEGMGY